MSKPTTKVWNSKEGRFTSTDENDKKKCTKKGGQPKGQNRDQRDGCPPTKANQNNRNERPNYQDERQTNRGQTQGRQTYQGQGQSRQTYQGQDQSRQTYQGQDQSRQTYQGQHQTRQTYQGQDQSRQTYQGQGQSRQTYQGEGQGQRRCQDMNQGQYNNWGQGQHRGQGPNNFGQFQQRGQGQSAGMSVPPPSMGYPQMMVGAPMYSPVMMQPMMPMYQMHPPPCMPPYSPPHPPPLIDEWNDSNENIRNPKSQGQGRHNFNRGRPPRGKSDRRPKMERSSSLMNIGSIDSQPDEREDIDTRTTYSRGRGRNRVERGQQQRGNMERSSSTRSIDSIGSQHLEGSDNTDRHRRHQNSGRKVSQKGNFKNPSSAPAVGGDDVGGDDSTALRNDNSKQQNEGCRRRERPNARNNRNDVNNVNENLQGSVSVPGPNNLGRDQGARQKQPSNLTARNSNECRGTNNGTNTNQTDRIRGMNNRRGKGGRGNTRGKRRLPIERKLSGSYVSDEGSVCSRQDYTESKNEKVQGHNTTRSNINHERIKETYCRGRGPRMHFRGRGKRPYFNMPRTSDLHVRRDSDEFVSDYVPLSRNRGNVTAFTRGRGRFMGNRGRFIRGKWSGLISCRKRMIENLPESDSSSIVGQTDSVDTSSMMTDDSYVTMDISDDVKVSISRHLGRTDICLDDINSVGRKTLKNRIMRYRKKVADMRKKNEDIWEIQRYQNIIDEIKEVMKEREAVEENTTEEVGTNAKTHVKEDLEVLKKSKSENTDTSSEDSSGDVGGNRNRKISKRVHTVLAKKGRVSYKPINQRMSKKKPRPRQTKTTTESSSADSDHDNEVNNEQSTSVVFEQKNAKQGRLKGAAKKKGSDTKPDNVRTDCEAEKEKRLTDILSKLDNLELEGENGSDVAFGSGSEASTSKKKLTKNLDEKPNTSQRMARNKANVQGPDVNEVFKFMVKALNGKGLPEEVKRESGIFPDECEEISFFRRLKRRFTVIERDGEVEVVMVLNRDATYCLDYITNRSCKSETCKRYHVCKDFLAGNCAYGEGCRFSHDFLDERNMPVSRRQGYNSVFTNDEICSILRVRYPHVCRSWLDLGTCEDPHCICLHLCPRYVRGQCLEGKECPSIHDRTSSHNKPIVDAYDMNKFPENLFKKMIYMARQPDFDIKGDEKPDECGAREPITARQEKRHGRERRISKTSEHTKTEKAEEKEESAICKSICEKHVIGGCRRQRCKFLHCETPLPYVWQIKLYGTWINLKAVEEIEKAFSDNHDSFNDINLVHNDLEFSVKIVFRPNIRAIATVTGTEDSGNETEARRLSTLSYKEGDANVESFKTQWRWYWMDDHRQWQLFEPDTMQHTLEAKFLAKQKEYNYSRENYRFKYILDFSEMAQRNIDTKKRRVINRRPIFVSSIDVNERNCPKALTTAPVINTHLPESWVPWDLASPFELVKIDENEHEYAQVSEKFFKTLDKQQIEIDAVFRMQNHKLWSLYNNQEKSMEANIKRFGEEKAVERRYLFHGTDNLDAVRGISINNFDVRVSGKNATMYGDGAYFARDAKYSHSYTKGPTRFMFMVTVLVGEYTHGNKSFRRPPNKPGSDHELYDSCVNDTQNPSIFIVFDKNQYYPEILIQYHKLYEEPDTKDAFMTSPSMPTPRPAGSTFPTTGAVGSSAMLQPGGTSHVNVTHQSSPVYPPRNVNPSQADVIYYRPGSNTSDYPGSQNAPYSSPATSGYNSGSDFVRPTVRAAGIPVKLEPARPKKKEDSTCCIQ